MYYLFSSNYYHHHHCYYFVDRHLNVVIPAVLGYPCILYSIICSMAMLGRVRPFSIHSSKLISKDNLIRIHQQTSTKPSSTRSYNILNIQIMLSWSVLGCPGVIRLTGTPRISPWANTFSDICKLFEKLCSHDKSSFAVPLS